MILELDIGENPKKWYLNGQIIEGIHGGISSAIFDYRTVIWVIAAFK